MERKRRVRLGAGSFAAAAAFAGLAFGAPATKSISGFTPARTTEEQSIEQKLRAAISTEEIRKFHRYLTSEPHPAGSERNNELARYIADLWKEQGLEDVTIREYDVLHSSPREVALEMVSPTHYRATLREDAYDADPDTKNP